MCSLPPPPPGSVEDASSDATPLGNCAGPPVEAAASESALMRSENFDRSALLPQRLSPVGRTNNHRQQTETQKVHMQSQRPAIALTSSRGETKHHHRIGVSGGDER